MNTCAHVRPMTTDDAAFQTALGFLVALPTILAVLCSVLRTKRASVSHGQMPPLSLALEHFASAHAGA